MHSKTAVYLSGLCALLLAACSGTALPTVAPLIATTPTLAPEAMAQTVLAPTAAPTLAAPTKPAPTKAAPTKAPTTAASSQPASTAAPAEQPTPVSTEAAATAAPQQPPIAHLAAGQPLTVTVIHMLDINTGWAVGHSAADLNDHILQTADGGKSWKDVTPPESTNPPDPNLSGSKNAAAFFVSAQDVWVAYGFGISAPVPAGAVVVVWNTHDGGQSWKASAPLKLPDLEMYWPSNLVFADGSAGWLMAHVGAGMSHDRVIVFATHDAGATWEEVVDPQGTDPNTLAMSCDKTGLAFLDAQQGWVSGNCNGVVPGAPYLYQTADGGHTWQKVELPPPSDMPNLYANESDACGAGAPIFVSATEGQLPVSCGFMDTNKQRGWLYSTTDAGKTWTPKALPTAYGLLDFISANEGWWAGNDTAQDTTVPRVLYHTTNSGQSWIAGRKLNWGGQLDFVTSQAAWAVAINGEAYALVQTEDGGNTWKLLSPRVAP